MRQTVPNDNWVEQTQSAQALFFFPPKDSEDWAQFE